MIMHGEYLPKNDTLRHLYSLSYSGFLQSAIGVNAVTNALYSGNKASLKH